MEIQQELFEGIAIGGDRYPGSRLIDHLMRYEANPKIKMLVALGEIGGTDEYAIVDALKSGRIAKPIVVWVTGTAAKLLPKGLQFGHAGAMADSARETADAKNRALREAGAIVPDSYEDFDKEIRKTFENLKKEGKIDPVEEFVPPEVPLDYNTAIRLGKVRRPTDVVVTISDDRGDVPTFALFSIVSPSITRNSTLPFSNSSFNKNSRTTCACFVINGPIPSPPTNPMIIVFIVV
ncbi:hypothetical protein ES708_27956 [subsurface metagenome]